MGGKSSVTIGYKYYLGAHLILCHGPVDSVQKIIVGDREAWSGNVTSSSQITINAPELFGGEKKEGGIQGVVDIMMGEPTQLRNTYLQSILGTAIPAFRGVVSFVLRKVYICAMNAYPKAWAAKIKNIPGRSWYASTCEINNSANPIHCIYETITNTDWAIGLPTATIDDAAFRAAALTCYNEGLGISILLSGQTTMEQFIYEILKHVNGILYTRPDTGQFSIKLLRNDYDVGTIPSYNESNISQLEYFERPSYAEMVNEIVVSYRPQGAINDDSVTVHDLASIQAQGGIVSQTLSYPGIDTASNAAKLAMRDLRQKSTPLARVKLYVMRKGWNLTPGAVFKLSWAEHNLVDVVFRVLGINYGDLKDGTIAIDAVEDIFALPSSTYMGNQTSGWSDPIQPPANYTISRLEESLYFDLNNALPEADFAALTPTAAYLTGFAGETTQYANSVEMWTRLASTSYVYAATGVPSPHGLLSADITETQTSFTLTNLTGASSFVAAGEYAYIEDELVRIDTLNTLTGAVTVGRGVFDTVPAKHVLGTRLLFAEYGKIRDRTEYAQGGTTYGKVLMRTGMGLYPVGSATEMSKTFTGRQGRPYAPGKLRINTSAYPASISTTSLLALTWTHRDRTQQLVRPIIDTEAGSIGPEVGVTYTIRFYDSTNILRRTVTSLSGTSYTWASEAFDSNLLLTERTGITWTQSGVGSGASAATATTMRDNNLTTGTATATGASWIQADLGSAQLIGAVAIAGGNVSGFGNTAALLNGAMLQHSPDASTWTDVSAVAGVTDDNNVNSIIFPAISRRYWRLNKASQIGVTEFRLYASGSLNTSVRFELESVRSSIVSHQKHNITLSRV